jgi:hypothetical protein
VLEFARLVFIVSTHSPEYKLQFSGSMCYWFASTIVAISNSLFRGAGRRSSKAGTLAGVKVYKDDATVIAAITTKYVEARKADPEPISSGEKRVRGLEEENKVQAT